MNDRIKCFVVLALLAVSFTSCEEKGDDSRLILPGKIAYWQQSVPGKSGYESWGIYSDGGFSKITVRNTEDTTTRLRQWLNSLDFFLGIQSVQFRKSNYQFRTKNVAHKVPKKENLVLVDLDGQVKEVIYTTDFFEAVTSAYVSADDSKILLVLSRYSEDVQKIAPVSSSLLVIDVKKKAIIRRIDEFELASNLTFNDSPWSPDGSRVVYGVRDARIIVDNKPISESSSEEGLYVLDWSDGKTELIANSGYAGAWSPVNDSVAYIKNGDVWIYDAKLKTAQIFYAAKSFENLSQVRWSPDGKYLRIHGWRYSSFGYLFEQPVDKVLQVADGKEIVFKMIGGAMYTWK